MLSMRLIGTQLFCALMLIGPVSGAPSEAAVKPATITEATLKTSRTALYGKDGSFVGMLEFLADAMQLGAPAQPSLVMAVGGAYLAMPVQAAQLSSNGGQSQTLGYIHPAWMHGFFTLSFTLDDCQGNAFILYDGSAYFGGPSYGVGPAVGLTYDNIPGKARVYYSKEPTIYLFEERSRKQFYLGTESCINLGVSGLQQGYKLSGTTLVPSELVPRRIN